MKSLPPSLLSKLDARREANALRTLPEPDGLTDFSSNDYLGFARNTELHDAVQAFLAGRQLTRNGSTGSRLISGNHSLYDESETLLAGYHQAESALIFNSGYDANVGFFSSVPQKGDVVLYDEYIHASIRDGIRLSNATSYKFAHNDLEALRKLLERCRNTHMLGQIYVATESVFSMDGDSPALASLFDIADQYDAAVVIDEAHAIGVFGEKGEGMVQQLNMQERIFARIVTFGKGAGCHGAAIIGAKELKEYLVNFARSLIYTTALPPHSLASITCAYRLMEHTPERNALKNIVSFFREEAVRLNLANAFIDSHSAIQSLVVGGNENARNISSVLQQKGFSVKAILSPTVPAGSERLRFCLHSYNTKDEVTRVLENLQPAILPQ